MQCVKVEGRTGLVGVRKKWCVVGVVVRDERKCSERKCQLIELCKTFSVHVRRWEKIKL
jgi:uncharacterized protein (UPF0179 family)